MKINSVPDVKCFCNNKNALYVQSMVWHFVRHLVLPDEMRNCQFIRTAVFGLIKLLKYESITAL